jgi:endonuclease YncB( thermonuclease family)
MNGAGTVTELAPVRRAPAPARRGGAPRVIIALLLAVTAGCTAAAAADAAADERLIGRVSQVADGDTLTLLVDDTRQRIRLHEIDAPEHDQPWAREARRALARKVENKVVRVDVATVDDYGRLVGKVWLGNRDINRELVREGHAWAFRRYLEDRSLLDDEAAARREGAGLWRQADPVAPWAWRQRSRPDVRAAGEGGAGCRIKGNISRGGERIYHVPGGRHYAQTRISPSRGERWFCSTAEAEQAGWRRSRE